MIEINDIDQMLALFGVECEVVEAGDIVYKVPMFGIQIIFSPSGLSPKSTQSGKGWRVIGISSTSNFEEKKMEVMWELMRSGYMCYLRTEHSNTFKQMINFHNWDRKIIERRLELYGDDPKYNYLRDLNKWALKQSASYLLSIDPGFFDFLLD